MSFNCITVNSDRENSTVFVANLPANSQEDDLQALFKDVCIQFLDTVLFSNALFHQCGQVREIKLTQLPNAFVATVEFMDRVRRSSSYSSLHLIV